MEANVLERQYSVIASEAKQSRAEDGKMDCFVALLLAMTTRLGA